MTVSYTETGWSTAGTYTSNVAYKEHTFTANNGDLIVVAGLSANAGGSGNALIETLSGSIGTWTIGASNNYNGTPGLLIGHAVASGDGSKSIRVHVAQTSGATILMGVAVWVISADSWTGTPAYNAAQYNQADAVQTVATTADSSHVIYAGADWSAGNPGSAVTPAGGTCDATYYGDGNQYGVFTAHWSGRGAGTTNYGAPNEAGTAWCDSAIVIEEVTSTPSTSGPNYAGASSALGGGSGSWVNPANATGAPDASDAVWTAP